MQCEFENWEEIGKDWCEDFSSEKNVCATSTALSHKALHYPHPPPRNYIGPLNHFIAVQK